MTQFTIDRDKIYTTVTRRYIPAHPLIFINFYHRINDQLLTVWLKDIEPPLASIQLTEHFRT